MVMAIVACPSCCASWGSGGIVALQFAMRNAAVAGVIGLDGSYGMHGERAQPRSSENGFPQFAPERFTGALLDLRRANGVQGATLDTTVVARLRDADRYRVTFLRMYHGDFTEWAPVGRALNAPLPPNPDGRTRETGYEGNQVAYRAVLDFLDAIVRHEPDRLNAMVRELQGLPGVTVLHEQRMTKRSSASPGR